MNLAELSNDSFE